VFNCPAVRPCPSLSTVVGEFQVEPTVEDLRCWLEALRDGLPGMYEETWQLASANAGSSSVSRYLVHDDRTYDVVGYSAGSNGSSQYGPTQCELYPADHYTACLDALDAASTPYGPTDCGIGIGCAASAGTCP
jgi:hypothetical protein